MEATSVIQRSITEVGDKPLDSATLARQEVLEGWIAQGGGDLFCVYWEFVVEHYKKGDHHV